MSCVVAPHEVDAAIAEGYKQIYIITSKGTFKHHILRGTGRFVRVKVDSIPGYVESTVNEGMNFLPAGKIPHELYKQVLAFFLKVMEVNTSEVEAMIHVLYNPERGYHLGVPPQTISKASVTYDWNYIPAGTSIIVDIHSHNTMGAFFSGTDNRDDSNNISFSGVFGHLKNPTPMTVWRFNYMEKKYEAKIDDIFEAPVAPEVEIPSEWMDQVKVTAPYQYQGGFSNPGNVGRGVGHNTGQSWDHLRKHQFPKGSNVSPNARSDAPNPLGGTNVTRNASSLYYPGQDEIEAFGESFGGFLSESDLDEALNRFGIGSIDRKPPGNTWNTQTGAYEPSDPDRGVNHLQEDSTVDMDEEGSSLGKTREESLNSNGLPVRFSTELDPAYEHVASIHGTEVADAWYGIGNDMAVLDGKDDLNAELIGDLFGLTSDEGQLKVIQLLVDNLSKQNRERLETHGFH
jgi:PRTRC genetic system protein A